MALWAKRHDLWLYAIQIPSEWRRYGCSCDIAHDLHLYPHRRFYLEGEALQP